MNRTLISTRGIVLAAAFVIGVLVFPHLWTSLLLVAIALMLAAALSPWVDYAQRRGLARGVGVLLVGVGLLILVGLVAIALIPIISEQMEALEARIPEFKANVGDFLRDLGMDDAAARLESFDIASVVPPQAAGRALAGIISFVSTAVTVTLLMLYFILDAHRITAFVYYLLPRRLHDHARYLMGELNIVVGGYVRGQLICSGSLLVFTTILLLVLRVPNALALGLIAFLGDMIPVIGIFVILIPTVMAGLSESTLTGVIVFVGIIAWIEFENTYLVQKVFGETLQLPSSAVLVGILIGGQLLGIAGALLALPATAALAVLIRFWHGLREGTLQATIAAVPAVVEPPPVGEPPSG